MVAVDVLYNTGARGESRALTGIAHLFEHLMFGGSVNVPAFDVALENAGGENNAWTSNDFTNFFDLLPAAMPRPLSISKATACSVSASIPRALRYNARW